MQGRPSEVLNKRHTVAIMLYLLDHGSSAITEMQRATKVSNFNSARVVLASMAEGGIIEETSVRKGEKLVAIYTLTEKGRMASLMLRSSAEIIDGTLSVGNEALTEYIASRYDAAYGPFGHE